MNDYISREDAMIAAELPNTHKLIDKIPSADVRENVRGEWLNMERIEDDKAEYITEWQQAQCSVCHKWHTAPYMYYFDDYNFCPNCGADMRGEA